MVTSHLAYAGKLNGAILGTVGEPRLCTRAKGTHAAQTPKGSRRSSVSISLLCQLLGGWAARTKCLHEPH